MLHECMSIIVYNENDISNLTCILYVALINVILPKGGEVHDLSFLFAR